MNLREEPKCQQNATSLIGSKAAGPPCSSLPETRSLTKMRSAGNVRSASKKRSSHKRLTAVLQQEVLGKLRCRQYRQTLFQCLPAIHHQKGNTRGITARSGVSGLWPRPRAIGAGLQTGRPRRCDPVGWLPHTGKENSRAVLSEQKAATK